MVKKIKFKIFLLLANLLPRGHFNLLRADLLRRGGIKMGSNVRVAGKFYATNHNIIIGNNVWIGYNFRAYFNPSNKIIIEDNVDIAPEVVFCCGSHFVGTHNQRAGLGYSKDIVIGKGCWIGIRSTILGGCILNSGCVTGANSFVKGEINPNSLVGGTPARILKELN